MGDLIQPNWHVILIHYPIALIGLGVAIELASYVLRLGTLHGAARWMVLIGALSCGPAFTSGLYAFNHAAQAASSGADGAWHEVVAGSSWNSAQWLHLWRHVYFAGAATLVALAGGAWLVLRWPGERPRMGMGVLGVFALSMGLLTAAAWNAGEAVWVHGAVMPKAGGGGESAEARSFLERALPPEQFHVFLAGLGLSLLAVALPMSMRGSPGQAAQGEAASHPRPGRAYALLAVVLLGAAAVGVWATGLTSFADLRAFLGYSRRALVHALLGTLLVVLAAALAVVCARRGGGSRLAGVLGAALTLVLAGQFVVGTLLMYDSSQGPAFWANSGGATEGRRKLAPVTPVTAGRTGRSPRRRAYRGGELRGQWTTTRARGTRR